MANYQQSQQSFNQYFSYGTASQYDNSTSQNKWGTASNTGNQTQASQSQNQQQMYQAAAQNYAAASGFYGNQAYGQQQSYAGVTGSVDNSMGGIRTTGIGNTSSTFTGNKSTSSYNSATTTTGSTNMIQTSSVGTNNYSTGFGSGVSFGNNTSSTTENKSGMNAANQMFGAGYGNINQNTGMNTNMVSNMAVPATSQTQSFGSTVTADSLGQFNQMPQLFGSGANYGAYTTGDSSNGSFSTGYNQQAFNTGMMTLLQQTLMQQANGGAAFGNGAGNTWGMSDADGGFYAPPVDNTNSYQSGGDMSNSGNKQLKRGKKWSGKEKQDFYGNRFAQMFTGMPGVLGQPQTGGGKGKRLMNGVRFNIKGEKVMDVEIPLSQYSRWGQLRKFFSKQDTEVAKHLIEFHDENCEECLEREQRKKKKPDQVAEHVPADKVEEEETEETEEDLMIRQVMGFGKFNTTREAMVKDSQSDATAGACVSNNSTKSTSSWETAAGFVGPVKPVDQPLEPEKKTEPVLTEEEKKIMSKLGWSVFNKKKNENGEEDDDDDDDDDNDDEGKMDIGGEDGTAATGL